MPKLFKIEDDQVVVRDEAFVTLADDEAAPVSASTVILSFARFQREGEAWLSQGARVGVRLEPDEPVEGLAYDLPRLALVALAFPKFRDGRAYSAATLLRVHDISGGFALLHPTRGLSARRARMPRGKARP